MTITKTMASIMRSTAHIALAVTALVGLSATVGACDPAWSDSDPLSIPCELRRQQAAKGNVVFNPSFEPESHPVHGRPRPSAPPGWEKVGDEVEWIDRESGGAPEEVHEGRCAIRIRRTRLGELDKAAGVVSDYIPVIPGNYDFTYAVRLKHVTGSRLRLGARLGDAVAVRVFYFDADKNPVDASAHNPVANGLIDASDKSYPFANYWSVDEFDWARVRARTYHYPFSEGDLPAGTRYVRLFLGLKGTGSMWLDSVDFRYSKWNFSALERMKPLIDRPLAPLDLLIPTPKEARLVREVVYLDPGSGNGAAPLILLPDEPAPADHAAARLLEKSLNAALDKALPGSTGPRPRCRIVAGDSGAAEWSAARLVFSIGPNHLLRKFGAHLPLTPASGNPQAYVIQPVDAGPCHAVFLTGGTSLANFYAAATAAQLLEADRCVYHSAVVSDFPDFLGRSYLLKRWETLAQLDRDLDGLELMGRLKLNKAYAGYEGRSKDWHRPDALFKAGLAEIGQRCRENGVVSLGIMVNPYSHFEFEPAAEALNDAARYTWTHASAASLETLQGVFKLGLEAGAGTVMLLADDFVPHEGRNRKNYSLFTPEDRRRFVNLQTAQAHVIHSLKAWLDRQYPGTRFEFCPPWYANEFIDRSEGKAEIYLKELTAQIPPDVAIIWTGPTVRSLSLDLADLRRFRNLIGRWPMFWDNTLYARNLETTVYGGYTAHYPGKVRLCNLFEPLDVDRPAGFHELNDGRHMYVNGAADSEVYRIKFATVADYEWNTSAYDAENSLWKALVRTFGAPAGAEALQFNDAYYGLYGIGMWMEREGVAGEHLRRGNAFLDRLQGSLESLQRQLPPDHALLGELQALYDRAKTRFERLARKNPTER